MAAADDTAFGLKWYEIEVQFGEFAVKHVCIVDFKILRISMIINAREDVRKVSLKMVAGD